MGTWKDLPLAAFDLETDGVDVTDTRIVTACILVIDSGAGKVQTKKWFLNTGRDMPKGASDVHGITTEKMVAEGNPDYAGGYEEIRNELNILWKLGKRIVAGYNLGYDLSVMHYEGVRLGHPKLNYGPVADPFVWDRELDKYRKGSRKLGDTAKHYGIVLDNAHAADADALAAARLAWKLSRHPDYAEQLDTTAAGLMELQRTWHKQRQDDYRDYLAEKAEKLEIEALALREKAAGVCSDWPIQFINQD